MILPGLGWINYHNRESGGGFAKRICPVIILRLPTSLSSQLGTRTMANVASLASAALTAGNAAAKASTFVVYPDAPHAFHADYRPSFRKEPAEDGWKRATAWFKQHGVA